MTNADWFARRRGDAEVPSLEPTLVVILSPIG
jgi:hypothetical protein